MVWTMGRALICDLKGSIATMAYVPKILAFAGSTRTESFNKKLIKVAIKGAEAAGAQVTYLDEVNADSLALAFDEKLITGIRQPGEA